MLYGKNKGGILVEFAAFFSILTILFYVMSDATKYSRWKMQLTNVQYLAISMLQNINYNNENPKYINETGIKNIHSSIERLLFQLNNIYIIKTPQGATTSPGIYLGMNLCYIKGTRGNRAKIIWEYASGKITGNIDALYVRKNPAIKTLNIISDILFPVAYAGENAITTKEDNLYDSWVFANNLQFNVEYEAKAIHPDLQIEKDEIKILLTVSLFPTIKNNVDNKTDEANHANDYSYLLGFYVFKIIPFTLISGRQYGFFSTSIIFSPNW